ncbi:hypothetical protein CERSUDRAFT_53677 [Gelatoporia subvermispora B]|uniref:hAT-like transposase RNase-H fold domain-containing protein n=1 Tax=Ceriporiopsis subvermispora (strain B) TaxID=914234 RepID=M2R929_CERS8|nr:hypothetical protein CERSUDRAFT_53677 [Gelatoporia subvermispora B]
MVHFALEYRQAMDAITMDHTIDLGKFELSDEEWALLLQLRDVLKIFNNAIQFFSCGTPNLTKVIPVIDVIDKHLSSHAQNASYVPAIRAALVFGQKTLNKYYNKTDHAELYHIAMVLHPKYKLQYFKDIAWELD